MHSIDTIKITKKKTHAHTQEVSNEMRWAGIHKEIHKM